MKDDLIYIGHMHDTALKAWQKIDGKTRADYDANEDLTLALAHLVQIIGEAARRVSEETQRKYKGERRKAKGERRPAASVGHILCPTYKATRLKTMIQPA